MFDSRIANVIAYGGLAVLLLVPASQFVSGWQSSTPSMAVVEEAPSTESTAAAAVTAPIEAAPAAQPEIPAGEVIRPGQRIRMTEEQIRGTAPAEESEAAKNEVQATGGPPIPRPRPQHAPIHPPVVAAKPQPRPVPAPIVDEPIVLGAPERPLGTMPAPVYFDAPAAPQPSRNGTAVETMSGWTDGTLEDYLQRQRSGLGRPDDRFVPPANVGY